MLEVIPTVEERLSDHYYIEYHIDYDQNGLKPDERIGSNKRKQHEWILPTNELAPWLKQEIENVEKGR